jgi:hypothetical protein
MTQEQTNTFFYLFSEGKGKGIEIIKLTTVEALAMWHRGRHWLDMPQIIMTIVSQKRVTLTPPLSGLDPHGC